MRGAECGIQANPRIVKDRYWLHKVAPLSGRAMFFSEWLAGFLPAFVLGSTALTALNIALGSGLWAMLGSVLLLGALQAGHNALDAVSTPVALHRFYEQKSALAGIIALVTHGLFMALVLGTIAIGQGGYALFAPLRFLGELPGWALRMGTATFAAAVIVLVLYFAAKIGTKEWETLEI